MVLHLQSHYAAIDLGSNSFHMIVMADQHDDGKLTSVNCKRELVQLAAGLDRNTGKLRANTANKAFRCLSSFSDYLSQFPEIRVRAVGTSAFRQLHKNSSFLQKAERALGLPIEILSGEDEAKLIYRGVSCSRSDQQRFVMDIGGGSTEFIVGQGLKPRCFASLELGSQTIKQRFFQHDRICNQQIQAAQYDAYGASSCATGPGKITARYQYCCPESVLVLLWHRLCRCADL